MGDVVLDISIVIGRRSFDFVDCPSGWGADIGYGAERDQSSHRVPSQGRA